jgi:hypothetical protein
MADAKSGAPLGGEGATLQAKLDGKEAEIETYKSEIAKTKKMMDENDVPFKEQLGYLKPMNERLAALDGQLAELHKMVTLLLAKGQNPGATSHPSHVAPSLCTNAVPCGLSAPLNAPVLPP